MSEYPVRDNSWWGRTRDNIAYYIALFAFNVVATKWYSAIIEGSIRLGLDAAREEEYASHAVHVDIPEKSGDDEQ